jgi:hypothetical protein
LPPGKVFRGNGSVCSAPRGGMRYAAAMAEIINLNRARKAKARAAAKAEAATRRVQHGRTAAERANDARAEARRAALLDAAKRDEPPG